jgi:flavorubredoxin
MTIREIKEGISVVGVQDWDRRLFDELIPLPNGTSYNSYIVWGSEKTALIDTVDPAKEKEFLDNLGEAKLEKLDYIVANHAEQDHSGTIPKVLELYPDAKVVCSEKCKGFLIELLHVPEDRFNVISDGDTLSLGDRTLEFISAPWVHWPETILTYLKEDRVLFSCDLFGSHLASSKLFACCDAELYDGAKRYYAEIMMPFRKLIKKHLEKVREYAIDYIATSHGPIYDNPSYIIEAYEDWTSDKVKNQVLVPYVSMHGSTQVMVDHFIKALEKKGIEVKPFHLTKSDIGEIATALVDAATVVIGTPTVLAGPHPSAVYVAYLTKVLRPKTRYLGVIGSYGWGGQTVEQLKAVLETSGAEIMEPVMVKGLPKEEDLKGLDKLAEEIAKRHQDLK